MKDILQLIGLLFLLLLSFLGANYIMNGGVLIAAAASFTLCILMYFMVSFLMKRKNEISKNKYSSLSIFSWILFALLNVPVFIFCYHALNVEINARQELTQYIVDRNNKNDLLILSFKDAFERYRLSKEVRLGSMATDYLSRPAASIKQSIEAEASKPPFNMNSTWPTLDRSNKQTIIDNWKEGVRIKFDKTEQQLKSNTQKIKGDIGYVQNWSRIRVAGAVNTIEQSCDSNARAVLSFSKGFHEAGLPVWEWDSQAQKRAATLGDNLINSDSGRASLRLPITSFGGLFLHYLSIWLFLPVAFLIFLLILPYILTMPPGVYIPNTNDDGTSNQDLNTGSFDL